MDRIVRSKGEEGLRPGRFIPAIGLSFLCVFVLTVSMLSVTTSGAVAAGNVLDGGGQEMILSGGDVVVIGGATIKKISFNQAPAQLLKAMDGDGLTGSSGHS